LRKYKPVGRIRRQLQLLLLMSTKKEIVMSPNLIEIENKISSSAWWIPILQTQPHWQQKREDKERESIKLNAHLCTQVYLLACVIDFELPGPIGNLLWEKEIEERAKSVPTMMMMSWTPWIQALIQMLPVAAGMWWIVYFMPITDLLFGHFFLDM